MKNKLNILLNSAWIRYGIVPLLFLAFGLINLLILASPINFTSISYQQDYLSASQQKHITLTKGDVFQNTVYSKEDNLGIISLHFINKKNVAYDDVDMIAFELRQKDNGALLYKNTYRADLLQSMEYFPIGFPQINDSKNKEYILSLKSLEGTQENAITIDTSKPGVQMHYIYPKKDIIKDSTSFTHFINNKFALVLNDNKLLATSIAYFLPFLLYLLSLIFMRSKVDTITSYDYFLLLIILLDIFTIKDIIYILHIGLIILWLVLIYLRKLESHHSYIIAFLFICVSLFTQIFGLQIITLKSSVWGYYFLLIGIIQNIIEYKKRIV